MTGLRHHCGSFARNRPCITGKGLLALQCQLCPESPLSLLHPGLIALWVNPNSGWGCRREPVKLLQHVEVGAMGSQENVAR